MNTRPTKLIAVAVALLTLLPACAVHGLAFSNDSRIDIVSPNDRAKVTLPITIKWNASGIKRSAKSGPFFVVFLDKAPIRPGQTLRAIADDSCNRTPGCLSLSYLRDRYVFVTKKTSLTLDVVPKPSGQRTGAKESHEATIILVNADGRRLGEAAYTVDFTVKQR